MNLLFIQVIAVTLLFLSGGTDVDSVQIINDGFHEISADSNESLIVIGGSVVIKNNSYINSSIFIIDGNVSVSGQIENLIILGGNTKLLNKTIINQELIVVGGNVTIANNVEILGDKVGAENLSFMQKNNMGIYFLFVQLLIFLMLGYIISKFKPYLIKNTTIAIKKHFILCFYIGLLPLIVLLTFFFLMAFTIILLPLSIIGIVLGYLLISLSTIIYGSLFGDYIFKGKKLDKIKKTLLGIVIFFILIELITFIPLIGPIFVTILKVSGLGAILITYMGLKKFTPSS